MQLSRIVFNSAYARLLRPREPDVNEREQPETAESPARAVAANRVTVPLVAFVGFLLLVLLLFVVAAVVGQAKIRADERLTAAVSAPLAQAAKPFSAEAGFARALATTRSWAEDAQLVLAQATFGGNGEFRLSETAWSYVFYSARRKATALVVAGPDRTDLLSTRPTSGPVPHVDAPVWVMNSDEALREFLARGGRLFLDAYPQATLTLSLAASGGHTAVWQGRLVDDSSGSTFHLSFDAATRALVLEPTPQE